MTAVNKISFNIDFTSDYRLTGWAIDLTTHEFPKLIQLHAENGIRYDISDLDLIVRTDVCEKYDLPPDSSLGFEINLLDIFNDRLHDYTIFNGEEEIWSQKTYFSTMDHTVIHKPLKFPQYYGENQVIVIYQKHGWLFNLLQKIHTLNLTFFDKNYQSGVSFLFFTVSEFSTEKNNLLKKSANSIFIIEQTEFRQVFGTSPTLLSKWPVIFLNKKIDLTNDFNGLLNVISILTHLNIETELEASSLAILMTTISAYNSLLFDNQTHYFSYQSGTTQIWMGGLIRQEIQKKTKEDVIVLSSKPINLLEDINPNYCASFVRTSALRFIIDSLKEDILTFLNIAYKRGLRIKILYEGDII